MQKDEQTIYNEFGKRLKSLRKSMNITQSELSKEIGISQTTMAQYEAGTRRIPLSVLKSFSDFFQLSLDDLIGVHIKSDNKEEEHLERFVISRNPEILHNYERWANEMGTVHFTDEELSKIIEFAKFVISQRKK